MSAELSLGGDQPIRERLPRGYFSQLAEQISAIGQLSLGEELETLPAPSIISTTAAYSDGISLDVSYKLDANRGTGERKLLESSAMISEFEPYSQSPDFVLYLYRDLTLNHVRHTRAFDRGAYLMRDGTRVELNLDQPLDKSKRRLGSAAWRYTKDQLGLFTVDEYQYFTEKLATFTLQLKEQQ